MWVASGDEYGYEGSVECDTEELFTDHVEDLPGKMIFTRDIITMLVWLAVRSFVMSRNLSYVQSAPFDAMTTLTILSQQTLIG